MNPSDYTLFYNFNNGQVYNSTALLGVFGINTATISIEVLNFQGFYPVVEAPITADTGLYGATASYTVVGQVANQSWTYFPLPLPTAKANGTLQVQAVANQEISDIVLLSGYSAEVLSAAGAALEIDRPATYQAVIAEQQVVSDQLALDVAAIAAATTVDEINNIVNLPTGILFTGRGSGLGPEDLNVSYYTEFNSVSMTESETELYVPGTSTTIAYGSGGPNQFDSMGDCFNPGDYLLQIRETATGMVIAEFECPLAPAGVDVAF